MSDLPQLGEALRDRYRVERELGAGGMATVYLAHDLKHDRDVAIKVLHPDLAAALGAERFLSEIKTTAKLQHPHILALIDSGEADGLLFYVMPFVQGETLRARLARERQLPVDESVRLAREVASALDYAHRQGVIHRDVKPENILLHDGSALVADFGISLAVSAAGGPRMTQTGLSLGTPQYMSPEQAMGERTIDARADIYALGAVTYEMLAGEAPFTGPSVQAIVARVITEQPRKLSVQRRSVPPAVEGAVMRALEKLPADRFGSAKEFGDALVAPAPAAAAGAPLPTAPARGRGAMAAVAAVTAIVAGGIGWAAHRAPAAHPQPVRFTIDIGTKPLRSTGAERMLALAPDGSALAYTAVANLRQRIFLRAMTDLEPHVLPGSEGAYDVAFSPDGQWLAFSTDNAIMKIPVRGGTPVRLAPVGDAESLSWPTPDVIIFSRTAQRSIYELPAGGGEPVAVAGADKIAASGELAGWPLGLPDGETVVYASVGADRSYGSARIALLSRVTGRRTVLELRGMTPFGMVGDHLVYSLVDGTLMTAPLDVKRQRLLGPAVPLSTNVFARNAPAAALSASGTFAFMGGAPDRTLVMRDRTGRITAITPETRPYAHPRLSPDGRRIALEINTADSGDIWILDRTSSTLSRLTTGGTNQRPEWSVDGRSVYYVSLGAGKERAQQLYGIKRASADGSAAPESVYFSKQTIREVAPTPDGRALVYRVDEAATQRDIWQLPIAGGTARPVLATAFDERTPRVSPDGHWIAYSSDEGGGTGHEVYVRAFPGPGPRVQISQGGGIEPVWSADGRRVFYRDGERMRVALLSAGPALAVTGRDSLFSDIYVSDGLHPDYDVAKDGSFVLLEPVGSMGIVVTVNWATELIERLGAPR